MKKYCLINIGCQQNEHDAKMLNFTLEQLGFESVSQKEAKYIIIVACAVRQSAVDRLIGKLRDWKEKKVIVTGCVLENDIRKLIEKGVAVCKDRDYRCLASALGTSDQDGFSNLLEKSKLSSNYVPIMYGCDNFCSYCAVPYTRGREKSRDFDEIISDVKGLVKKGEENILLLGQNVNSYKSAQRSALSGQPKDFSILLKTLNDIDGNFEISFTSNHPKDMSDDIIEAVSSLPKIKKEIHLPVQSGSNKILKAMNRPYTIEQYLKIVEKIRTINSDIKITTDVIVGFPGESEQDFQKTVDVFNKVNYAVAYVNKYSPRNGTAAYKLGNPISWQEKKRRWKILNDLAN